MSTPGAIDDALRQLGLENGDAVFIHADLQKLGMVRRNSGIGLAVSPQDLLAALRSVLGDAGTIVVPTYTPDWEPDTAFDPETTPGRMGAFSELVRQLPDAIRTEHPMLSLAAVGRKADDLLAGTALSGYGAGSPFSRMVQEDVRMLMVGVPLCSFKDHIEWRQRVPYRYEKCFRSQDGQAFRHNVRYRLGGRSLEMTTFIDGLTEQERSCIRTVSFGKSRLHAIDAAGMDRLVTSILSADPFRFVTDDLGYRSEMTFLKTMSDQLGNPDIEQIPDGERWTWSTPDKSDTVTVAGAELCIQAAGQVLDIPALSPEEQAHRFISALRATADSDLEQ